MCDVTISRGRSHGKDNVIFNNDAQQELRISTQPTGNQRSVESVEVGSHFILFSDYHSITIDWPYENWEYYTCAVTVIL